MPSALRPLTAALAAAMLSGCGLLFPKLLDEHDDWKFGDPPPPLPRTAYSVEGMVSDHLLHPVEGAEIELRTSRPGYVVRTWSGPDGRFHLALSTANDPDTKGSITRDLLVGGVDDTQVTWVEVRAYAGDRCSHPVQRAPAELDRELLVLELWPCTSRKSE